jgi:KDO2-lipid IV(A) lauroyltransferase
LNQDNTVTGKLSRKRNWLRDWIENGFVHGLIDLALLLPYRARVRLVGAAVARALGPLAGFDRRIDANLRLAMPDLDAFARRQICRNAEDNFGRSLIESYSYEGFAEMCQDITLSGPGWEALEAARKGGRPSILFTGHFGNFAAIRLAVERHGHKLGVLYRPFNNPYFERRHRCAQSKFGLAFPRETAGIQAMLRNIREAHITAIVGDQHVSDGAALTFFGLPAATSTAAARLALKYDAALVPAYAVRRGDGFHFDVVFDTPIAPSLPEEMSQQLNNSLEGMIRAHPGQWLWTHRRWKVADNH